jgi:hypothetical protein
MKVGVNEKLFTFKGIFFSKKYEQRFFQSKGS